MAVVAALSGLPFDPVLDEPLELERFTRWSIDAQAGAERTRCWWSKACIAQPALWLSSRP
jgi:hypothetical protein